MMPRFLAALSMLAALAGPLAVHARACDCLPQTAAQEALKASTLVMVADVLEKTRFSLPEIGKDYKEFKIKIRVREYWKGKPPRVLFIRTPAADAECQINLESGRRYLIYAVGAAMPMVTSCTRTVEAGSNQAKLDIERLGPGTVPEEE